MTTSLGLLLIAGFVALLVLVIVRESRPKTCRCPKCLRLGRTKNFGRFTCGDCGASFVLDSSGKPTESIVSALAWPVTWRLVGVAVAIYDFFERHAFIGAIWGAIFVVGGVAEWRSSVRQKRFPEIDSPARR